MSQLISIGQLIDRAIELYTAHFKSYIKVTLWFGILFILLTIGILLGPKGNAEFLLEHDILTPLQIAGMVIVQVTSIIGTFLVSIWVYINLVYTIEDTVKSRTQNPATRNIKSLRVAPHYFLVAILRFLITSAPILLTIPGIGILFAGVIIVQSSWLTATGIFLLLFGILVAIVGVVLVSVWFAFVGFEVILGNVPVLKTFASSKALTTGRFWQVVLRLYVPKLVFALFIVALQIGFFLLGIFGITGLATFGQTFLYTSSTIITNLFNIGIMALSLPIFVITDYLLYDSLKTQR